MLDFVANLPRYAEKLAGYTQDGNRELYGELDAVLDRAEAGVLDQSLI